MSTDFIACHEEEIHIPGYIQDFGYLIGLDDFTKGIKFLSENVSEIFPLNNPFFGKNLEDFPQIFAPILNSENYKNFTEILQKDAVVFLEKISINDQDFHFTSFHHEGNIFLQFEKILETQNTHNYISRKYESINNAKTEEDIWCNLLNSFAETVNYDRMMVYQFLEDGSGVVIAERKKEDIESYLHLHYPESDIPKQARELYLKKRKRILSNANHNPVAILSNSDQKVDLTYSNLRALSPVHNQYLKNGGAISSFSTSIVVNDELWGLVTCQNITPKHVDLMNRIRAEVYTIIAANTFTALQAKQNLEVSKELDKMNASLMHKFLNFEDLEEALIENREEIRHYPTADGLAIVIADKIVTSGTVPSDEDILRIRDWVRDELDSNLFTSNEFRNKYFPDIENAAGLGMAFLDSSKKELLLWFRKELNEDILWAGNPEKLYENVVEEGKEKMKISPRKSFAVYKESIKGKSPSWQTKDIIAIKKLVEIILEASYNQFVKVKNLLDELKKVNEELDSFSYTISHDLGTPLTVMKLNAQMLISKNRDNEDLQKKLNGIVGEIDGMAEMMRDVLLLSRAKSQEIQLEKIPTENIITKIKGDAIISYGTPNTEVLVKDCPEVLADKTLLYQVFLNVITNAVKYSSQQENPCVEINGEIINDEVVYRISDNGIGIQDGLEEKMFKIFNRMDNAKNFKGNGVGLSIVHRIMLRLGGSIFYESVPQQGTTFILKFKKP